MPGDEIETATDADQPCSRVGISTGDRETLLARTAESHKNNARSGHDDRVDFSFEQDRILIETERWTTHTRNAQVRMSLSPNVGARSCGARSSAQEVHADVLGGSRFNQSLHHIDTAQPFWQRIAGDPACPDQGHTVCYKIAAAKEQRTKGTIASSQSEELQIDGGENSPVAVLGRSGNSVSYVK